MTDDEIHLEDFQPLVERWGRYKLPSGVLVMARISLTVAGRHGEKGRMLRHAVHMEAVAPARLRGQPGNQPFRDEDVVETVTEFATIQRADSKYEFQDGSILALSYHPKKFKVTKKFNPSGEPILGVESDIEIELIPQRDRAPLAQ